MRRLIAIIALLVIALPAQAADKDEALVIEIGRTEDGSVTFPNLIELANSKWNEGPIHYGYVGHYLWLEWGEPGRSPDSMSDDYVSIDISDPTITAVAAYPDGTVEIEREAPVVEPEPPATDQPPAPEERDLVEEFPQIRWDELLPAGVRPE